MPRVSRIPLRSEEVRRIRQAFLKTLANLRTSGEVDEFLQDFLTLTEWGMFVKRLAVTEMLIAGKSYAAIQQTLKVSNTTIARMQNFLQLYGSGLRKAVERYAKEA